MRSIGGEQYCEYRDRRLQIPDGVLSSLTASMNGRPLSALDQAVNDYGVLGGAAVDLNNGEFSKTGNDLDLALEGSGFFVVQTRRGPLHAQWKLSSQCRRSARYVDGR